MPKAVRRTVNSGLGNETRDTAIGLQQMAVPHSDLRGAMGLWQKRLNVMSGAMVLLYKHAGIPKDTLRGWVIELRALADAMDRYLR